MHLLRANHTVSQVFHATEPYLIRALMTKTKINAVFIRVRLWEFINFGELQEKPVFIFLSGGKDKLTQNPATAVQFSLREPFNAMDICKLNNTIKSSALEECLDFFFLRYNGRYHKTMFSDIELIERKEKNYLKFYLGYANPLIPGSLVQWLQKIPEGRFIRVSDNLIIPVSKLYMVNGDEYKFKERVIPLSFRFLGVARNERNHWPDGL